MFMLNNREATIKEVEQSLIEFIQDFHLNPFEYFYEEDLRAFLLNKLRSKINIKSEFPTLNYSKTIKKLSVNSSIIKAEYPSYIRFDIALLGYDQKKDFYNQPVVLAIELKLGSDQMGSDRTAGFQSDIIKLKEFLSFQYNKNFIGIAIYFCQTPIEKDKIDEWYQGILFEQIYLKQIKLDPNSIYAILVTSGEYDKIYLSKFEGGEIL